MVKVQNGAVLKPLRVLLNAGPMAGLSDQELLERFMEADRDAADLAFAAIVDRHGPMVRRVCRQVIAQFARRSRRLSGDLFHPGAKGIARSAGACRSQAGSMAWLTASVFAHGRPTPGGDGENEPPQLMPDPWFRTGIQATVRNWAT